MFNKKEIKKIGKGIIVGSIIIFGTAGVYASNSSIQGYISNFNSSDSELGKLINTFFDSEGRIEPEFIKGNSIDASKIKNNTLTEIEISDNFKARDSETLDGEDSTFYKNANNINTGTLNNNRLDSSVSKIGQTIGNSELEDNAVNSAKVQNESITSSDILNGTIQEVDLATVLQNKINSGGAGGGGAGGLSPNSVGNLELKNTDNFNMGNITVGKISAHGGIASGFFSTAIGFRTTASGFFSTAMGRDSTASGYSSRAMGENAKASGFFSTAIGNGTTASGAFSTAIGNGTTASGNSSTAMGNGTTASGNSSTAMGRNAEASGYYSTAMGRNAEASGYYSTAMGHSTKASGNYSTAMGYNTKASGGSSTAMGYFSTASGFYTTAMGFRTTASGFFSTAMGRDSTAMGRDSTAMGHNTKASGDSSTAMGSGTTASGLYSTIVGKNGQTGYDDVFAVAYGTPSDENFSGGGLIFKVKTNGNVYADGGFHSTGADYAEYFEADNVNELKVGDLVGFNQNTGKVRKYQNGDEFMGIISNNPSLIGNTPKGPDGTIEEWKKTNVIVGLLGQVDFNKEQVNIISKKVYSKDGKKIGLLLNNGKVFIK